MTERGLPIVDGPAACPFVAFDDDRDERATSPDHRHRCYAELMPAPRALAHQAAYCLSSAFPVCPTFQDWARREAARATTPAVLATRPPGPALRRDDRGLPPYSPDGGFDDRDERDEDEEPVFEDRPRRHPQRDWASPPPWLNRADGGDEPAPVGDEPATSGDEIGGHDPDAERAERLTEVGLAGSFADRLTSSGPAITAPAAGERGGTVDDRSAAWQGGDRWDDELEPAGEERDWDGPDEEPSSPRPMVSPPIPPTQPPARHRERERERVVAAPLEHDDRPSVGESRHGSERNSDLVAPSWERPARLEAYPSLRSRRMPSLAVPGVLLGAAAVLLAAVLLFILPGFLGIGSPRANNSPSSTVAATLPGSSVAPTEIPTATQQTYTVQSGDTMSRIANRFGIPLQTLINANTTNHPNPNVLNIGDVLIIPSTTPTALPGATP
jgi:LysM domain